jgi:hypothetical protein
MKSNELETTRCKLFKGPKDTTHAACRYSNRVVIIDKGSNQTLSEREFATVADAKREMANL